MRVARLLPLWILIAPLAGPDPAFAQPPTYITEWGSQGTGDGQFDGPMGIAYDPAGFLYVTDLYNDRIQKFDLDGNFILSWDFEASPFKIAIDAYGYLYVTAPWNNRVRKYDGSGTLIKHWRTTGNGNGEFVTPSGIAVGIDGSIYVSDGHFNANIARIQRFTPDGVFIQSFGSFGTGPGQFSENAGLGVDSKGFLYVPEAPNLHRVQKLNPTGGYVLEWGTFGPGPGEFKGPYCANPDPNDNIYVAEFTTTLTARVQAFTETGSYLFSFGQIGSGPGALTYPSDVAPTCDGTFVVDFGNHRIVKFSAVGGSLSNSLSSVEPWDTYGQAFVIPGAGADNVQITALTGCGDPIPNAVVEIDLSGCSGLCIDTPNGLSGTTNAQGSVVLNPAVGGCDDCPVVVRVNGTVLRTYNRITSTDWDGCRADGQVDGADSTFFAGKAILGTYDTCVDYNGSGTLDGFDLATFSASLINADQNDVLCPSPVFSVEPWDTYGQAFISPGTQSTVDLLTITAQNGTGPPMRGVQGEVDCAGWNQLCFVTPNGLAGVTNASGIALLNPRGGGCQECDIAVLADTGCGLLPIRRYSRVVSTDWDGTKGNGVISVEDASYLVGFVVSGTYNACLDYNGDGLVDTHEGQVFSAANYYPDRNTNSCLVCTFEPSWIEVEGGKVATGKLKVTESPGSPVKVTSLAGPGWAKLSSALGTSPFQPTLTVTPAKTMWGKYTVTATINNQKTCSCTINVFPAVTGPPKDADEIEFAFSPHADGLALVIELPEAEAVSLKVYDIQGRLTRTVHDGDLTAGRHRFTWDGRSIAGSRVPAGIYLLSLETAQTKIHRKAAVGLE